MEGMMTIGDVFASLFPAIKGISWDVGTALIAFLFLGLIVTGFDYVRAIIETRYSSWQHGRWADQFSDGAKRALDARSGFHRDSQEWLEQDMLYKDLTRKAARSRMKSRKW